MTVAGIRPVEGEFIPVMFLESARFYRLPKNADPAFLDLLKRSEHDRTQVVIKREKEESDLILSVEKIR